MLDDHAKGTFNQRQLIRTPLLLGSVYGIMAGIAVTLLLMGRIVGEEAMLARELEGYLEYTKRVRYRLFRGIW